MNKISELDPELKFRNDVCDLVNNGEYSKANLLLHQKIQNNILSEILKVLEKEQEDNKGVNK